MGIPLKAQLAANCGIPTGTYVQSQRPKSFGYPKTMQTVNTVRTNAQFQDQILPCGGIAEAGLFDLAPSTTIKNPNTAG